MTLKGVLMASLFKKKNTWYLSVSYKGKRKSKSLNTRNYKVALQLKSSVEVQLLQEVMGITKSNAELTFPELVERYLTANHAWADSTRELYGYVLNAYLQHEKLPTNPSSRATYIRHINQCWKWGHKNNLVREMHLIPGETKCESRLRTYTDCELSLMFTMIKDEAFNSFVRFAYYTGARSGEIRSLSRDQVLDNSLVVCGKTGRRMIKLNSQAKEIVHNQNNLWNYTKNYVSHKFKSEVRSLGIKNARFHDLRRTFGLNLIKQGMSIYKVSKLLGHKSVRTTEKHYAPLLTVEIEDFII